MARDWLVDCVGVGWLLVGVALGLMALTVAILDPMLGAILSFYALFLVWRGHVSWTIYRAARLSGTSRAAWRREAAAAERQSTVAARDRLRQILDP